MVGHRLGEQVRVRQEAAVCSSVVAIIAFVTVSQVFACLFGEKVSICCFFLSGFCIIVVSAAGVSEFGTHLRHVEAFNVLARHLIRISVSLDGLEAASISVLLNNELTQRNIWASIWRMWTIADAVSRSSKSKLKEVRT